MEEKKVSSIVQDIITSFKTEDLEIVSGYRFNQYKNVIRINLYLNQRFIENTNPDAIFWDLSSHRITHTAKNIDLDTKDLMPYGVGETNFVQAWILRAKLKKWLREYGLATLLDDLTDGVAAFGSAVWKVCKTDKGTEIEEVDLRNLYFNQTAKYLKDVPVVELHYLTPYDIRKKETWDNTDKVLTEKTQEGDVYEIWEFWGEVVEDKKPKLVHQIGYDYGDNEVILFDEEYEEKDFPYRDFHIGKYRGRWQRIGIVERLYKLQEEANKVVNLNSQSNEIASLLLLRSKDVETGANVLEQAVNGQIISSADIQQIGIDNRAFTTLLSQLQGIEAQADKMCLTPDIVVGETMPSGTPFRSLATLANAAKSAFKSIRDRIGSGIEDILLNNILPDVVKGWNREELMEISEDESDVSIYDDSIKRKMAIDAMLSGQLVDQNAINQISEQVDSSMPKIGRKILIPKGYFNFDYGIKFNITGENFDKQQQNDAMFNALQMIQANPAITNIPLFKQYCENNGISWWRLSPKEQAQIAQQTQPAQQGIGQPKTDNLMAQVNSNV